MSNVQIKYFLMNQDRNIFPVLLLKYFLSVSRKYSARLLVMVLIVVLKLVYLQCNAQDKYSYAWGPGITILKTSVPDSVRNQSVLQGSIVVDRLKSWCCFW